MSRGRDEWTRCPDPGCRRKVLRAFREDARKPPSGRYYVLDGMVYQFAKGSRWSDSEDGQVALCPRGHRVSATLPPG